MGMRLHDQFIHYENLPKHKISDLMERYNYTNEKGSASQKAYKRVLNAKFIAKHNYRSFAIYAIFQNILKEEVCINLVEY
jgi:hypothetical protein